MSRSQNPNEFLVAAQDTFGSAKVLLDKGDVFQWFMAAFLTHLAVELLLKSAIISSKKAHTGHVVKDLFVRSGLKDKGFALSTGDEQILSELDRYHKMRYPDQSWNLQGLAPDEPAGIDDDDINLAMDFYKRLEAIIIQDVIEPKK